MNRILLLLALAVPLLWSCDSESTSLSGTNDETTTSLGVIRLPDGKPAVGARVLLYASGDTQATPRAVGIVDNDGHVTLAGTPQPGLYNLLIRSTRSNEAIFQDSLVSDGKRLTVFDDTLRRTGKLVGRVRVQPQDKPTIAWVQLIGAGRYVNLDDSGRFAIDSLPAGRFTLAAQTREPKYTTTFCYPAIRSDSLTDLGAIDLIYTGVPMVRNVKATWDSVSATGTVRWDSVPEPGLLGYRVYRSRKSDPQGIQEMAYVTSGRSWTDTLFRGLKYGGSLGGQYDSIQADLYYRVVAVTNNGDSPMSFADSVNVRSPVLTHSWNLPWSVGSAMPAGYTAGSLDSLGNGVAMLATKDSFQTLWTSPDGKSWSESMTLPANVGGVFWKGKLWWITSHQTGESYDANALINNTYVLAPAIGRLIDTIHVHSFDGNAVRTNSVPVRGDTVTAAAIVPAGDQLVLAEEALVINGASSVPFLPTQDLHVSVDGNEWTATEDRNLIWWYSSNQSSYSGMFYRFYKMAKLSDGFLFGQTNWIGGGDSVEVWKSSDTKQLDWPYPGSYGLPQFDYAVPVGNSILFTNIGRLRWAPQSNLREWHEVAVPGMEVNAALPWRNQLLVTDGLALWSAPLPSGI